MMNGAFAVDLKVNVNHTWESSKHTFNNNEKKKKKKNERMKNFTLKCMLKMSGKQPVFREKL